MDAEREWLEAQGYKVYDHAGDAVGMTEEEKQLMEIRVDLALKVRKRREELGLTQKDLAIRLKTSQPRVVKIEWGSPGVSLEQILNAFAVMGGRVAITELPPHSGNGAKNGTLKGKKKSKAHAR